MQPAASLLLAACVLGAVASAAEPTVIKTVGQATAGAEADFADFFFSVVTYGEDAGEAASANAQRTRAVIDALSKRLGDDSDIQTTGYAIHPNRKYSKRGPEEVTGYSIVNSLRATVKVIDELGEVLDVVTTAGADKIDSVQFRTAEPGKLRSRAFQNAVEDARSKAEAIAEALGLRLVRIVSLDEAAALGGNQPRGAVMQFAESIGGSIPTPIQVGTVQIRASVVLTAELAP